MNRTQAKELLPIITAFANGFDVEVSHRVNHLPRWELTQYPKFDPTYKYRVKPKARTFWINPESEREYCEEGWIKVKEILE